MTLHPVCSADYKNRVVEHLKRPLHLCGKVDMPRRVKKRNLRIPKPKNRLL